MRVFKTSVVLIGAVFFIACGSSESTNTNSSQATVPGGPAPAPSASSNTSAPSDPVAASSSNANHSTDAKPAEEKKDAKDDAKPAPKVDALALFAAQKCAGCHGADGKGKIKGVPDFTDAAWQKKIPDAAMVEQIKLGKPPKMPPYEGKLKDTEIKALVAYIRSFAK